MYNAYDIPLCIYLFSMYPFALINSCNDLNSRETYLGISGRIKILQGHIGCKLSFEDTAAKQQLDFIITVDKKFWLEVLIRGRQS